MHIATLVALDNELTKIKEAFSITDEGHEYDAALAKLRKEHGEKTTALAQKHNGMGSTSRKGKYTKSLRGFSPKMMRGIIGVESALKFDPRHQAYVEKKHNNKENAYNIFGGILTPTPTERNPTKYRYGEFGDKEKKSSPAGIGAAVGAGTVGVKGALREWGKHVDEKKYNLSPAQRKSLTRHHLARVAADTLAGAGAGGAIGHYGPKAIASAKKHTGEVASKAIGEFKSSLMGG